MHTYRIEETESSGSRHAEMILAIVVLAVLVACGLASVPVPSRISEEEAIALRREKMRVTEIEGLRTRDGAMESELKKLTKALEGTKSDLASFRQVHDTLIAQVALTTSKMQEVDGRIEDTKAQAERLSEYAALQEQLQKERDQALTQAKDAGQRIRELTLKLQRAGVYP